MSYQRNRVRHSVIPALEEAYPDRSPVTALAALAKRMTEVQKFLAALTAEKLEAAMLPNGTIRTSALSNVHGFPLHGLLEAWIAKVAGHYRLTENETRKIERFLHSTARKVELRHGLALERKKDRENGEVLCVVLKS
jgi:hypothetical protein